MRLSDLISQTILEMLNASEQGQAEIKRNELANDLGCVPSQINYVLSSRFTPEQGYIVESRRGGGGYIKITKVQLGGSNAIMHIINSIGDELNANTARIILHNLLLDELIDEKTALLISAATSDKCYSCVEPSVRNNLRADIFKNMLAAYVNG